jgi:outer membrane protein assembly factor BamD
MLDLRDDTQRVFVKNYPNSPLMHPELAKGTWWKFWSKAAPMPAPKDVAK